MFGISLHDHRFDYIVLSLGSNFRVKITMTFDQCVCNIEKRHRTLHCYEKVHSAML